MLVFKNQCEFNKKIKVVGEYAGIGCFRSGDTNDFVYDDVDQTWECLTSDIIIAKTTDNASYVKNRNGKITQTRKGGTSASNSYAFTSILPITEFVNFFSFLYDGSFSGTSKFWTLHQYNSINSINVGICGTGGGGTLYGGTVYGTLIGY